MPRPPHRASRIGAWTRIALIAAAIVLARPASLHPHGGRLPLEQWGGFDPQASRCQRAIAYAASYCASRSWRLRERCRSSQVHGGTCDENRTTSRIRQVRAAARDHIDRFCPNEMVLFDLSYLGSPDLQTDLIDFCRAWERAAESAVFGSFLRGDLGSPPTNAASACIDAAASTTTRLMTFTFAARLQAMNQMAVSEYSVDDEVRLYDEGSRRIERSRAALVDDLSSACRETGFQLVYGKEPRAFLDDVGVRADCIGAQFYIQDRFLCPAGVCGNGVLEPGEDCDDGNQTAGDRCDGTCRAES
jgi:cysteine-rich repeat protein